MRYRLATIAASIFLYLAGLQVALPQQVDAVQSATDIMKLIGQQKYKDVWAKETSDWFKQRVPSEDMFLANMSMGRAQLGNILTSVLISSEFSKNDAATSYQGDVYAITFKNSYKVGSFYERIVVIKDADGEYRLSGIFGSPAQ